MALDALRRFLLVNTKPIETAYRNRLVIPNHDKLKLKLLEHIYNLLVAGYPSQGKTLELL
jgi:hypothetical protein